MKIITLILFVVISTGLRAQPGAEADVAKAVEALRQAMISGERKALENIADVDLTYSHSSGLIENKSEFVEAIASGKSDFVAIELKDQTIKIVDNIAIVRHKAACETNNGGVPGKVNLSVLLVWLKVKGEWKLLARHVTKI